MNTSSYEAFGAGYALAYREARRGLEDQERSVVELRATPSRASRRPVGLAAAMTSGTPPKARLEPQSTLPSQAFERLGGMPYEQTVDFDIADGVRVRFSRSGRPIARYAVVLLVLADDVWEEVRLFDNHLDDHHMHRYTSLEGKQPAETFHPGPVNAAIAAAIAHLKAHWEAIIESWRS
jgi:hypothetical protein